MNCSGKYGGGSERVLPRRWERGSQGERWMAIAILCRCGTTNPPVLLRLLCHNLLPRSMLIIIETSMTSLDKKKSVDTILACCLHLVASRAVTFRFTASAFSRNDPRRKSMSSTVGVVCAMAEWSGDRAWGCGDTVIAWSKYWNNAEGLFVFAQRWGSIGHNQLFSETLIIKHFTIHTVNVPTSFDTLTVLVKTLPSLWRSGVKI